MLKKHPQQEQGQSLVLVALMAIVLVAFVGLAIDGGNAYNQRRISQNAADGAAVRGAQLIADNAWQINPDPIYRRDDLLRRMNDIAEMHGVPDTNGTPGDAGNANLLAYFTDQDGNPYPGCDVASCTTIPADTYGVEVYVSKPFDTFFTGVIGWNEMTVSARAVGLARVGRAGFGGQTWAVYAFDDKNCSGGYGSGYEVDLGGAASNEVRGNSHSNGHYRIQGATMSTLIAGQITYVDTYVGNLNYYHDQSAKDGLVLPNFATYYNLAQSNSQLPGGTYIPSPPIPAGYTRPTHVLTSGTAQNTLGNATTPYAFINGDLVLTGDNPAAITLGGLIVVNGNVLITARTVSNLPGGTSLLATGVIQVAATSTSLTLQPFQDVNTPPIHDPLLDNDVWRTVLWSNADMSAIGSDPCQIPVIQDLGSGGNIRGAVMAPDGMVEVNSSGPTKIFNGTIIADMVYVRGANRKLWYNSLFFPPQPDFVELME